MSRPAPHAPTQGCSPPSTTAAPPQPRLRAPTRAHPRVSKEPGRPGPRPFLPLGAAPPPPPRRPLCLGGTFCLFPSPASRGAGLPRTPTRQPAPKAAAGGASRRGARQTSHPHPNPRKCLDAPRPSRHPKGDRHPPRLPPATSRPGLTPAPRPPGPPGPPAPAPPAPQPRVGGQQGKPAPPPPPPTHQQVRGPRPAGGEARRGEAPGESGAADARGDRMQVRVPAAGRARRLRGAGLPAAAAAHPAEESGTSGGAARVPHALPSPRVNMAPGPRAARAATQSLGGATGARRADGRAAPNRRRRWPNTGCCSGARR